MNVHNLFSKASLQKPVMGEFECPSCGEMCSQNDENCPTCSYSLSEYKSIVLAPYAHFNSAITRTKDGDYFGALLEVVKYRAFYANDRYADQLYVYLLYKNDKFEEYYSELEAYEEKYVRDPWIMEIELQGIEAFQLPTHRIIEVKENNNAFQELIDENLKNRAQIIKDIKQLINDFYDIVRVYKGKKSGKQLVKFYKTNFIQFLSKREIAVVTHDGQQYDVGLTDPELETLIVYGRVNDEKRKDGSIITYYPAVFVRRALISKEVVACVDNKVEKESERKRVNRKRGKPPKRRKSK